MPLLNDVQSILIRLAPRGWRDIFLSHGLDITVPIAGLKAELEKPLPIDRTRPGFEEFAFDGRRGIEPGLPGLSLLYHGLASADVKPSQGATNAADFPTLSEIDIVENYVYSTAQRRIDSFANPVLAVVAYQYREKSLSTHRKHADLCFSRTGVARVGTEPIRYDPASRTFDPRPVEGDRGFAALPARYGLFIAEYRNPTADDQVLRQVPPDATSMFLFPVHKIFPGKECLWSDDDTPLDIGDPKFVERHINEKLRRLHTPGPDNPGRVPPLAIFNLDDSPFVRVTPKASDLVGLRTVGASVLTVPVPNTIARTATQKVDGIEELARFTVPAATQTNRFWTSLELGSTARGRAAPEYANIRQEVTPMPTGGFSIIDLNQRANSGTPFTQSFDSKLRTGGFEAAHFVDGTCDGVVSCRRIDTLPDLPMFPAYSLVAAVDYFPRVEQVELTEWIEFLDSKPIGLADARSHFPQGGPSPFSDGRFQATSTGQIRPTRMIPNQTLFEPLTPANQAFPASEAASHTVTAIVGRGATASSGSRAGPAAFATTWLPDAASNVFAPGWDVSQHVVNGIGTYMTYGLGSPFPEDAKLCAALNSFWPAAAPDASRTYGFQPHSNRMISTSIPMTDGELGYHPMHPRVGAGEKQTTLGWDGDTGPFLIRHGGKIWVNASNPDRADETRAAFDNKIGFSGLDAVTTDALIERMEALRFCRAKVIPPETNSLWLVTVEVVLDFGTWVSAVNPILQPALAGPGIIFVFVEANPTPVPADDPALRLEFEVLNRIEIHLDRTQAFMRRNTGPIQRIARP